MDAFMRSTEAAESYTSAMAAVASRQTPSPQDVLAVFNAIALNLVPDRALRSSLKTRLPRPVRVYIVLQPLAEKFGWSDFSFADLSRPTAARFGDQMATIESFLAFRSQFRAKFASIIAEHKQIAKEEADIQAAMARVDEEWAHLNTDDIDSATAGSETSKLTVLEAQRGELEAEHQRYIASVSRIRETLPAKMKEMQELRDQVLALRPVAAVGVVNLQTRIAKIQPDLEATRSENDRLISTIWKAEFMLGRIQEIGDAVTDLLAIKAQIAQSRGHIDTNGEAEMERKVTAARAQLSTEDSTKAELEATLRLKEDEIKRSDERISAILEEKDMLVHNLNRLEKESNTSIEELNEKIAALKTELTELRPQLRLKNAFINGPLAEQARSIEQLGECLTGIEAELSSIV